VIECIVAATIVETASGEVLGAPEPAQAAVAMRINEVAIQIGIDLRIEFSF
jgi:hypothetical protein